MATGSLHSWGRRGWRAAPSTCSRQDGSLLQSFFAYNARSPAEFAWRRLTSTTIASDVVTAPAPAAAARGSLQRPRSQPAAELLRLRPVVHGRVFVAAGDLNGDGHADIVTGPARAARRHVKAFNGATAACCRAFLPTTLLHRGVRVAVGDVNGDGKADIVTGPGPRGGPHVKAFDGRTLAPLQSFFAYDPGSWRRVRG